jgi:hypothetical protein
MITGTPGYISPPVQSLRCTCGVRFVVLVGPEDQRQSALAEAARIHADFIDARRLLSFECYCGEMIDVSLESTYKVQ